MHKPPNSFLTVPSPSESAVGGAIVVASIMVGVVGVMVVGAMVVGAMVVGVMVTASSVGIFVT